MTLTLGFYRALTRLGSPLVPGLLKRRESRGKEPPGRRHERLAKGLAPRPDGPLIWFHGASVGESLVLVAVCERLAEAGAQFTPLFTTQTKTADVLLATRAPAGHLRQLAPVDTPGAARRFVDHWQPDLAVFAEGEIWPNLLTSLRNRGVPTALINARMTEKTRTGWGRIPCSSRQIFGRFNFIFASDELTAEALTALSGMPVPHIGNLKTAIPMQAPDETRAASFRVNFIQSRQCLVAASTHPGEEDLVLDAWGKLDPRPALILVPRHPERGGAIAEMLTTRDLSFFRISKKNQKINPTDICLGDTVGDMPLWLALADRVYLGGGHATGVGGHNPMEPVRAGKPVYSGPDVFNFAGVFEPLANAGLVKFVTDARALEKALKAAVAPIDEKAIRRFLEDADAPMVRTVGALTALLSKGGEA